MSRLIGRLYVLLLQCGSTFLVYSEPEGQCVPYWILCPSYFAARSLCKIDLSRPLAIKAVKYCGSAQAREIPSLAPLDPEGT